MRLSSLVKNKVINWTRRQHKLFFTSGITVFLCLPFLLYASEYEFYTQASLLYWQASEKGLDYGLKNTEPQSDSKATVLQPTFPFEPSLRLILGTHLPYGCWDLDLTYSFYLHSVRNAAKASINHFGQGILAVWTAPGAFVSANTYARWQEAKSKWKFHGQFFDFLLRCNLRNSQTLFFQTAFGLKMALLQQRYNVSYSPGNTVTTSGGASETLLSSTIHMKNRSFNLGPEVSVSSRWCFSPHWRLLGSLSGALLAAQFNVGRNEQDLSQTTATLTGFYRFNDEFWTYRPQSTATLGVQWNYCPYALALSYEAQLWWKQNMLLRHIDAIIPQSPNLEPSQGNLYLQGLTPDFLIDF